MTYLKLTITSFLFLMVNFSFAGTNLYTDSFGNTTGTVDGQSVNLYTDSFGNTTGSVGGKPINSYTDSFGNTTGR